MIPFGLLLVFAAEPTPIAQVLRRPANDPSASAVRGTVTYLRRGAHPDLIVQDATGGLYVSATREQLEGVGVGDVVAVGGTLGPGNFSPRLTARTLERTGTAPLPDPPPAAAEDLWTGRLDCRRVTLRGVVRTAVIDSALDPPRLIVTLATPTGTVDLWVLNFAPADADGLADAELSAVGVVLAWDTPRQQFRGVRLLVNAAADLRVLRPPSDPFALPAVKPSAFGRFTPAGIDPHRVKVAGVVTWQQGGTVVLQDGPAGVRVRCLGVPATKPGDRAEAVGFPAVAGFSSELQDAILRVVGTAPPPDPVSLPVLALGEQPDNADFDLRVVRVRGTLRLIQPADGGVNLHLERDGAFFTAFLPGPSPRWEVGGELELVGVCELQPSARTLRRGGVADRFSLLLRDLADVTVVSAGPWLTPARLGAGVVVLAAVLAGAGVWVVLLRRLVAARTARLVNEVAARHDAEVEGRAVAAERRRVAGELHDTLEQALFAVALQVEAAELAAGRLDSNADHLRQAKVLLLACRRELREAIHDLRPADSAELPAELEELAKAMSPAAGPAVTVRVSGSPRPLTELVVHHTLRAARELVTNAVKHAAAAAVSVELDYTAGLTLTVRDDGLGFAVERTTGYGLPGLRERAVTVGGTFVVASAPGGGTTAVWRVPPSGGAA